MESRHQLQLGVTTQNTYFPIGFTLASILVRYLHPFMLSGKSTIPENKTDIRFNRLIFNNKFCSFATGK